MPFFQGLPGKSRTGSPKRTRNHYQTNMLTSKRPEAPRPPEAPGGPRSSEVAWKQGPSKAPKVSKQSGKKSPESII